MPPRISHPACHILRHKFAKKRETSLHNQWMQSDEGVMKWPDFVTELNREIRRAQRSWTDFTSDRAVVRFLMRNGGGKPRFVLRFDEETRSCLDKTPLQGIEADLDSKSSVQADADRSSEAIQAGTASSSSVQADASGTAVPTEEEGAQAWGTLSAPHKRQKWAD